jgi:hypothetical protein
MVFLFQYNRLGFGRGFKLFQRFREQLLFLFLLLLFEQIIYIILSLQPSRFHHFRDYLLFEFYFCWNGFLLTFLQHKYLPIFSTSELWFKKLLIFLFKTHFRIFYLILLLSFILISGSLIFGRVILKWNQSNWANLSIRNQLSSILLIILSNKAEI